MKDLFPISVFTIIVLFSIYQNFRIWDKVADDNQFTHQVIIENKKLIKQFPKHIKIKKDDDKFQKTNEALQKGYDLIHKAHFKYNGWVGEIDFLIKVQNKKTKNGGLLRFSDS